MTAVKTTQPAPLAFDVIVTAVEGGIGYWAMIDSYDWKEPTFEPRNTRYTASAKITCEGKAYRIDFLTVRRAFQLLRRGPLTSPAEATRGRLIGQQFISADDREIDANDADIIVQLGLFGQVVYG